MTAHLTQDEEELVASLRASGTRDARGGGVYMSICDTAADAISRIAEEREEARRQRDEIAGKYDAEDRRVDAEMRTLEAALSQMKEALKPFAREADARANLALGPDIDHWPIGGSALTLGDLRAASRALAQQPDKEGI